MEWQKVEGLAAIIAQLQAELDEAKRFEAQEFLAPPVLSLIQRAARQHTHRKDHSKPERPRQHHPGQKTHYADNSTWEGDDDDRQQGGRLDELGGHITREIKKRVVIAVEILETVSSPNMSSVQGSFYLKKGETELWTNAGNMMIVLSLAVNMLLWAVAAWAIQNTLERNYEELSKPLPENIDLHWEDYKVPLALRMVYAVAAVTQILICHAFFMGASTLFGEFKVSDKIEDLQLYGVPPKGLFSFAGVMAIGVYFLAWAPFVVFIFWERSATLDAKLELLRQLAGNEESWKEQWLKELEEPEQPVEGTPDDAKVLDRQVSRHESKESATGSTVEATWDGPHGLTKEETLVCDACTSQMYVKDDAAAILELESVKEHLSELEEAAAACQMAVSDATLECQVAEEFSKCMVQSPKTMPALEPSPTLTAVAPGAYTASAKTSTSTSSTAAPSSVTPKARRVSAAWNAGTALEADKPYNAQEKPLAVAPQYLCTAGSCAPQCGKG